VIGDFSGSSEGDGFCEGLNPSCALGSLDCSFLRDRAV
jgi:hypothetical protein